MSVLKTGVSALGKLLIIAALAASFVVGMVGVVYLSLRGEEVKVPEIVGRDFSESEREIESLGLKLKRRAFRYSEEKPNTVLEQLPRPGETVKTGQTILVVLSQVNPEGAETPAPVKKPVAPDEEETDATDLEPNKPKKANSNVNAKTKKPAASTRDVISNKSNSNANANTSNANQNNSRTNSAAGGDGATPKPTPAVNRNSAPPGNSAKPTPKPAPSKPPADGDTRTRRVP